MPLTPEALILYDTARAAEYLHMSESTLEKWRCAGSGPPYRQHGRRVLYALHELQAWSEGRLRQSTSQAA